MNKPSFLTYGMWKRKTPTNPVLLPQGLANAGCKVLFVEQTAWNRGLTFRPWDWNKLDLTQETENIHRLTLHPPLPRKTYLLEKWFHQYARRQIAAAMKQINFPTERLHHILFSPIEKYALDWMPELPYIYRVIDDYTAMPMFAHDIEGARRLDEKLARNAVMVLPSNPKLFDMKKELNPNTFLIANAVNFDHFSNESQSIPDEIAALPKPIIGFAGALDKYKVDFDILDYCAKSKPDWSFALLGDIGTDDKTKPDDLPHGPNLHYLGFKPYKDLPGYIRGFTLAIIPYTRNDYTEGVFPLKLYEYLACGKPVVTTNLPFVQSAGNSVGVANDKEEFLDLMEKAISEDNQEHAAQRVALARENSWYKRAEALIDYLDKIESVGK